jgi:putative transposase
LHSIALMCRLYNVTWHGYNPWRRRGESSRRHEDSVLYRHIKRMFGKHDSCYGSPKITRALRKQELLIGQKRVARIMREHGLRAIKSTLYKAGPGMHRHVYKIPCRIAGQPITRANQLWVGDVTYIKLRDGCWQYLCTLMYRYSRRIIAGSLSDTRDGKLTLVCLERAIKNRCHHKGLIFHSDRGVKYLVGRYQERLLRYEITQNVSPVKKKNDNAFMASFNQLFKTERIKRIALRTTEQLRGVLIEQMWHYSFERSHSTIGYISPDELVCKMTG